METAAQNISMQVQPRLSLLNEEQITIIHEGALRILKEVGVRVDSPRAREVYARGGSDVRFVENNLFLDRGVIEWAIKRVPSSYDVFNRRGEHRFTLGSDQPTRFGAGVTNLHYQDPTDDHLEPFSRKHMGIGVRLVDSLPQFDVCSTLGVIRDYPPKTADMYAVLEMVANTTKPLVLLISDEHLFPRVLEMIERVHGDVGDKPFIIPYLNPVTPLVVNDGTTDKLLDSIEHGIAAIYSNYGMAGMSTPITCAGTLAMLDAELLAGLVLSQLAKEGAPIILGSLPAFFEMRTMVDFYDPQTFLINLGCAEIMAYYGVPHAGTSGSGEGWGPDLLAAGNLWTNQLTSVIGKAGLVPFVGSSLNSKAYSPALTVYSNDIIGQVRSFADGFSVDEASVGIDELIEAMAVDGHFLTSPTTMSRYKNAYWQGIFPHISLEKWEEMGHPRANQLVRDKTMELIEKSKAPDDHDEIIAQGEAFIEQKVA
jgi:trimethylamine---corrinoid protein Co-methyltransferase